MIKQWQAYSDKFLVLTMREQYLILLTGLVAVIFISFYLFIGPQMNQNTQSSQAITRLKVSNKSVIASVKDMQAALQQDPNDDIRNKIAQYEAKLAKIDESLLTLTSELISPVQMRYALLDLLKLEQGVSLLSFELLGAQPLLSNDLLKDEQDHATAEKSTLLNASQTNLADQTAVGVNLYRHGFKIKLSGSYFELRNYLSRLEKLSWKFFWQDFNFKLIQYPNSELEIQMYSLGTKKEFVGV